MQSISLRYDDLSWKRHKACVQGLYQIKAWCHITAVCLKGLISIRQQNYYYFFKYLLLIGGVFFFFLGLSCTSLEHSPPPPVFSLLVAHSSFWRAVGPSLSSRQLSPPSLLIPVKWEALPLLQGSLQSLDKAHAIVCELDSSSVTGFPLVPLTWEGLRLSVDPWKIQGETG